MSITARPSAIQRQTRRWAEADLNKPRFSRVFLHGLPEVDAENDVAHQITELVGLFSMADAKTRAHLLILARESVTAVTTKKSSDNSDTVTR